MNQRTFANLLLSLVLLTCTFGCTTDWSGKKKSDQSTDILAEEGIEGLKEKKHEDAIETSDNGRDRYADSGQVLSDQIKSADTYFHNKKYDEAFLAYKDFEKLHPTDKAVPYCVYRQGLCYYKQRSTIDRDQIYTTMALEEFRRLKKKYPGCEYAPQAEKIMAECRNDLARHECYIAEFYFKTKRYQAAIERYRLVDQEFPEFTNKAALQERIEQCQQILTSADKKSTSGLFAAIADLFDARW
jgi:outer membrane protein assembly factor BamD